MPKQLLSCAWQQLAHGRIARCCLSVADCINGLCSSLQAMVDVANMVVDLFESIHGLSLEELPLDLAFSVQYVHHASVLGMHFSDHGSSWIRFATLQDTMPHLGLVKRMLTVNGVLYFAMDSYQVTAPVDGVYFLSNTATATPVTFGLLEVAYLTDMHVASQAEDGWRFTEMTF